MVDKLDDLEMNRSNLFEGMIRMVQKFSSSSRRLEMVVRVVVEVVEQLEASELSFS